MSLQSGVVGISTTYSQSPTIIFSQEQNKYHRFLVLKYRLIYPFELFLCILLFNRGHPRL